MNNCNSAVVTFEHNELKKSYENDDKFKLWDPNNPQGLCLDSKIERKREDCMEFIYPYAFEGFKDLIHFQVDHIIRRSLIKQEAFKIFEKRLDKIIIKRKFYFENGFTEAGNYSMA